MPNSEINIQIDTGGTAAQAAAEAAARRAITVVAHAPTIGENGNWLIWNAESGEYADTDVSARGSGSVGGVSITSATINADRHLLFTMSDGSTIDAGSVGSNVNVDTMIVENGGNPVTGGAVFTALAEKAEADHGHEQSDVTGLADALAGKADVEHAHEQSDVTGLADALAGKADADHAHEQSDVTGLADALAGKADADHAHEQSDVTGLADALAGKADADHAHEQSDVTGLADMLAGKADAEHGHEQSDVTGLADALATKSPLSHEHPAIISALAGKANLAHEHTVLPFAYAFQNDQTVRVTKRRGLISGTAVGTAGSLYWPWVIRVDDKLENPLGKYYLYLSPDHAYARGLGIELYYSDNLTSGWTRYGVVYRVQQNGAYKETETPSVVWDHENNCFIMYLHGSATYTGEGQTTWRLTSADGISWGEMTKLFDLDGERLHGNLHNGYFLPFRLGDMYFGYSLMGGDSGGSALHWSEDGYTWTTDHRKLGRWMIRADNKCLFPHHGTVVFFQGMCWFLGVYANIVSGTAAKISRIAMAPLSDLRTPYGKPRILIAPDGDCEADDLRSMSVFCENGRLYVYYSCATSEASWVNCAVIEDGASGATGGFEEVILINAQPASLSLSVGNITSALSITALATDGSEMTYQWYSNTSALNQGGTMIEGATDSSYIIPTELAEGSYYYYCVATSSTLGSVTSGVATVTVGPRPVISFTQQPGDTTVIAGGISESLTALASASDNSAVQYQWYRNTLDSNTGGTLISGATDVSFSIPSMLAEGTYFFYCVASSATADALTSDTVTLTVAPQPVVAITSQPVSMSFAEGDVSGNLSVTANASDGSSLSYQWYSHTENNNSGGTPMEGETAAAYPLPTDMSVGSYYYYCMVTAGSAVVASEPATITVRAASYLARYALTGEAGAATLSNLADESGNENAPLSILGVSAYNSSGCINLNGTAGNALQVEGLNLNGSTSYKLHARFVSKDGVTGVGDGTSHRLLNIPGVDFNLMLVAGGSSSDCMKLETTNENYVTQTSTNTPNGIRRPNIAVLDIDVRVANDVLTITGSGTNFAGLPFMVTISNVAIPGFTAALSETLYVGNRADGTRPVNGSVTELWIQETAFVSLSFTTQPIDARCDLGNVSGSLSAVAAASNGTSLSYQWYSNTVNSAAGGTSIEGATGTNYELPANLTKGMHYYYCVATSETAGMVHSSCATVTVVAYIAKYALLGTANAEAPATIADISGNSNASMTVNGVTSRDEHGRMMLTETGQSLYLPSIANLPASYKLHIGFRKETMNQHRIFMMPAHDLHAMLGNVTTTFTYLHVKLESSSADAGFVSPMSICDMNAWDSLASHITMNATLDIAVSGDELTASFYSEGIGSPMYGVKTTTVTGFTAALQQGVYLGNRDAGDRPLGGAIMEFWIEEV